MSNRKLAIKILEERNEVILRCNGKSMTPILYPGESIYIRKVDHKLLRENDTVFCRIKGNLQVHLISAIDSANDRYQISNAKKFVNGWINSDNIFGLAIKVEDKILVSDAELEKRRLNVV